MLTDPRSISQATRKRDLADFADDIQPRVRVVLHPGMIGSVG